MTWIKNQVGRLHRKAHKILLHHVTLPLINRELRKGSFRLYRYVVEADRLYPCSQFKPRDFHHERKGSMLSDRWYTAISQRGLEVAVAFDIGANYGYTAKWLSDWAEQVYAFEPNPDNRERIREQLIIRNVRNVEVIESAVAAEDGKTTLFIKSQAGHHSLGDIGASQTIGKMDVAVTTLDRFCDERSIDRVGFVKIDVEGFEPDVLTGASTLLRKHAIKLILFEFSPAFYRERDMDPLAPIDVLDRFGYRVWHLDGTPVDRAAIGEAGQTDLLASPRGSKA